MNIEIKTIPYSDRVIDYGSGGLALGKDDVLSIIVKEDVSHEENNVTIVRKQKLTEINEVIKESITGRYLRVTVLGDSVAWDLLKEVPEVYIPEKLKKASVYNEN